MGIYITVRKSGKATEKERKARTVALREFNEAKNSRFSIHAKTINLVFSDRGAHGIAENVGYCSSRVDGPV